jgi:release factor glutamine methyltransferase
MTAQGTTQSEPWTILRLLEWTTEYLKKHGSPSPRLDAEILLAHARDCPRIALYTSFNLEPDEATKATFRELVKRRAGGEPVAYLVGKKEFYSLEFCVSKDCLVPRGETEHLVIECLDRAKKLSTENEQHCPRIIDVCTGSGCVAISLAKHLPKYQVTAIDLSPEAIAMATRNVLLHQLDQRVQVLQGDLLAPVENNSALFVVSNPPYVSESEYAALDKSVRDFEPQMALVAGPNGTEIIERLICQSMEKLVDHGWLLCELSPMIADRVEQLLLQDPHWTNVAITKDLAGLKRIAVAQKSLSLLSS